MFVIFWSVKIIAGRTKSMKKFLSLLTGKRDKKKRHLCCYLAQFVYRKSNDNVFMLRLLLKSLFCWKKFCLSVRAGESVCIVFLKCHLPASVKKKWKEKTSLFLLGAICWFKQSNVLYLKKKAVKQCFMFHLLLKSLFCWKKSCLSARVGESVCIVFLKCQFSPASIKKKKKRHLCF